MTRERQEHLYGKMKLIVENNMITLITIDDIDVEAYITENTPLVNIKYNFYFPHKHDILILEEYVLFYFEYLKGVVLLQEENQRFSAELATHIYSLMSIHWRELLKAGQHLKAILFFKHILKITLDWERKKKCHIHKGSLYGYIAFTYLIMGDSYSGFSYLNCALADDIYIGAISTGINYPKLAPSNLTISLSVNQENFMYPFVANVKTYLYSFMDTYKENYPTFKESDFDTLFLENSSFIHIKTYFVFCIWNFFDNINKYEFYYTENSFNKQTNLISLFNLSLVLDNVLKHYQYLKNERFNKDIIMYGDRLKRYVETSKMNSNYYMQTKDKYYNLDLDISIPELLKDETDVRKAEVNYLLSSLFLRNFVAHKIEPQEISFTHYNKIIRAQIYSLIMILKHYNS